MLVGALNVGQVSLLTPSQGQTVADWKQEDAGLFGSVGCWPLTVSLFCPPTILVLYLRKGEFFPGSPPTLF